MSELQANRFKANLKLFQAKGSSPLADWQVAGVVKHRRSPSADGFVYELKEGSPATRIELPRKGKPPLGLRQQRLTLDLWGDPALPFSIEVIVRDGGGTTRVLTLSRDCMAPELTHGSPKAKLPLAPPPSSASAEPGWRIVDLDLQALIPRAFDGAAYHSLEGVAIYGACMLRSVEGRAEPPPAFTVATHVPLQPRFEARTAAGRSGAADTYRAVEAAEEVDYGDDAYDESAGFERPAERAAKVAAAERRALEAAQLKSRAAQAAFLKAALKTPDDDAEGDEAADAPPSAVGSKLKGAVSKLAMLKHLTAKPHAGSRRQGDPRHHRTVGGEDADASMYRREGLDGGKIVDDAAASKRKGVAAAQELCRRLRRGDAPPAVDMSGVAIGEGGTKLLCNALAAERAGSLRSLTLAFNGLGDRGSTLLAGALRANFGLRTLDLHGCEIGAAGGLALAGAVEVGCPGLHTLVLSRNEIGAAGVAAMVLAARSHAALTLLDLEHTGAAIGLRALFRTGDTIRFDGPSQPGASARVTHEASGRSVPRLDRDGPPHHGHRALLSGLRDPSIGRTVDARAVAKPPITAAFVNVATNAAVEAITQALARPFRALRVLRLGGNPFGAAAREDMGRALSLGPNASAGLALKFRFDDGSDSTALRGTSAEEATAADKEAGVAASRAADASTAAIEADADAADADAADAARLAEQQRQTRRFLAEQRSQAAAGWRSLAAERHALETEEFPEIGVQRSQLERSGTWAPDPSLCSGDDDVDDVSLYDAGSEIDEYLEEYREQRLDESVGELAATLGSEASTAKGLLPASLAKTQLLMATGAMSGSRVSANIVET